MERKMEKKTEQEHDLAQENRDEFWEKECEKNPDSPECKVYDD